MVLRIFKMIATSGFLTALECTKFVSGRRSAEVEGALLPTGREEMKRGKGEKKERGREREGPPPSPFANSGIRP